MRRDPFEIMERIIRMLESEREAMSVNQIAQKTGLHNVTVRRYVRIIKMVRREPVEVIQTRHSIILRCERPKKKQRGEDESEDGREWY